MSRSHSGSARGCSGLSSTDKIVPRVGARVLLFDQNDHILLMSGFDPAHPQVRYWFTPGGGVEAGETPRQGAARELYEETGLSIDEARLGPSVHWQEVDIPFDGAVYRQKQAFFVVRTERFTPLLAALDPDERRSVIGHRWWSPEELRSSGEVFYPDDLLDLIASAWQARE